MHCVDLSSYIVFHKKIFSDGWFAGYLLVVYKLVATMMFDTTVKEQGAGG